MGPETDRSPAFEAGFLAWQRQDPPQPPHDYTEEQKTEFRQGYKAARDKSARDRK